MADKSQIFTHHWSTHKGLRLAPSRFAESFYVDGMREATFEMARSPVPPGC